MLMWFTPIGIRAICDSQLHSDLGQFENIPYQPTNLAGQMFRPVSKIWSKVGSAPDYV